MIRALRQYWAISKNAFIVGLSDPVHLIMLLTTLTAMALVASLPTFNFGQELRLVRDQNLALVFLCGCALAGLGAFFVVCRDLRRGTVSVLMSRPVSPVAFILGKWTGLAGGLLVFQLTATVGLLWITRITDFSHAERNQIDQLTLGIYFASIVLSLALMAVKHYLFGGWYVWQANVAVMVGFAIGFVVSCFFDNTGAVQAFGANVDWPTVYGCVLIFLAQLVFLALLMPLAIRLDQGAFLAGGAVVFAVGLLSQQLDRLGADVPWVRLLKVLLPNWQSYWAADFLADMELRSVAALGRYGAIVGAHTVLYVAFCLALAVMVFGGREYAGANNLLEN